MLVDVFGSNVYLWPLRRYIADTRIFYALSVINA